MPALRNTLACLSVLAALLLTGACASVPYGPVEQYFEPEQIADIEYGTEQPNGETTLRLMTLNMAHGRGTGRHQFFATTRRIKGNLDTIADVIRREQPDIVALQETDNASGWSGTFNHVEYLLDRTGHVASYQGLHVQSMGLQYGTALLAGTPLRDRLSLPFEQSSIPLPRGFVIAGATWPGDPDRLIDVVSVHLDFLSGRNRRTQAETLVKELEARSRPVILMGDLNTEWAHRDGVIDYLMEALNLSVYRPDSEDIITFPGSGRRIDWILVSSEFEFVDHKVLTDKLSDHRAVIADIRLVTDN
ncbi:MAG: endonuclease/exonuclease/phosphatase family protein [Gammaproteobacteria bacterium]